MNQPSPSPTDWYAQGLTHRNNGNTTEAIASFNRALNAQPDFKEACLTLAVTLEETGQTLLAIKLYEHLLNIEQYSGAKIAVAPLSPASEKEVEHWFAQGAAFQAKGDLQNAADAFGKVLAVAPDMPEALVNLAVALHYMGRHTETQQTLLRCLRARPGYTPALNILGSSYGMTGKPLMAIAAWRQIIASEPNSFEAWINLAKELSRLGCMDDAIKAYEQTLRLRPRDNDVLPSVLHLLQCLSRWDDAAKIKAQMLEAGNIDQQWTEPFFTCVHVPEIHSDNAKRYAKHFFAGAVPYDPKRPLPAASRANGKLHIGYISSDFYEHATAYLISEMFEQHDREHFEIYAYSHGVTDNSPAQRRIKNAVDQFHNIETTPDREAADLIRSHGIDIVVDLKGYTRGQRLGIAAQRPAPIQMHYLGFPGTMCTHFLDYFITDTIASPQGSDALFSEALIRLPHSYQINDRSRPIPSKALPRNAYGLPEQGLVFCDFNNSFKITSELFAVWMRLLKAVEGSVLWLYETYGEATANMKKEAQKHGVDPSRIITAQKAPLAQHLARYQHVDIFLDAFPCNGHTTASDALWCGVPVVTLAGPYFVSRVAASLLHAAELPELVASDIAHYEALALALARDNERRGRLKKHLEEGRMRFPLFDSLATTRAIENAYLTATDRHRQGLAPQAFRVE